jgi:putative transposase
LKSSVLSKVYRNERDARVKERLLLIIRISSDKQHIEYAASELQKSRAWAYKWYKRHKDEGIEGLRDKPRSGKPCEMSKEETDKTIKELSNSKAGWDFRQVMDLIQKKTGVKYHEVHIRRLLHKGGFSSRVPQKRFVRKATKEEKKDFKKGH